MPWIRVGSALCGEAAGADAVVAATENAIACRGIEARVSKVGCIGLCFAEPLLDIQLPGQSRVFYGNVSPESVDQIIESHLVRKTPLSELALGWLGESPVDGGNYLNDHPMKVKEYRVALRNAGHIDPSDVYQYINNGGYSALNRALFEGSPEDTLEQVNLS